MMKRNARIILLIGLVIIFSVQLASAEGSKVMDIFNTRLITNDNEATFIEGELASADGQTIDIKSGIHIVAEKKMPNTGRRTRFRIKVPADEINKKKMTVFFVELRDPEGSKIKQERVEIEYKERLSQKIDLESKEYDLTFPSVDTAINAEATSGEGLVYTSSDTNVASVDEYGKIITKGSGDAEIRVKQIGNSEYKPVETTVKVSVEAIDAYSITFHSSDDEEETSKQIIPTSESQELQENNFKNGDHEFLGWATSDEGAMEYLDTTKVSELAKTGENVDLYAVWSGDGTRAAVAWAKKIAADDSFSYGLRPKTNRVGCYFCGTNQRNKPKGYEKTYVCVTFVHAAFAHGAEDPELLRDCQSGRHCISMSDSNFSNYSCWKKVGLAKNLSVSDLQPGDVIVAYAPNNYGGHTAIYVGDNTIVDASGNGWGANTIAVREGKGSGMLNYARKHSGKSFVMRYVEPDN